MNTRFKSFATVGALSVLALISGCAAGPKIDLVAPGETLSISVAEVPDGAPGTVAVGNDAVGIDFARGAGGGMVALGAAGMSCGPWALICVPVLAVSGFVVGGAGGAIVGSFRGVDAEQKAAMLENIDTYLADNRPADAVTHRVIDRVSGRWEVVEDATENRMTIEIQRVGVDAQGGGAVTLELRVAVAVRGTKNGKAKDVRRIFSYKGPPKPVGLWIENADGFVETEFDDAWSAVAEQIYYALYGA
jgi:hypothetical protein